MDWIGTYKLINKKAVRCDDPIEWAIWMETARKERKVAHTHIGDCYVSTVFLGLDHNFMGRGAPLLFETMAFGPEATAVYKDKPYTYNPDICSMNRYSTWGEAEAGHKKIVAEVELYVLDTAVRAEEAIMAIAAKV